MDGEEIARKYPSEMIKEKLDIRFGLASYQALDIARRMGLRGEALMEGAKFLRTLYEIFDRYDAEVVEINPLVKTGEGEFNGRRCQDQS